MHDRSIANGDALSPGYELIPFVAPCWRTSREEHVNRNGCENGKGSSVAGLPKLGEILKKVRDFLHRYIVFPDHQAIGVTLWAAHCWVVDAFRYTAYLHILSPEKRCGKSTLINCLALMVPKPRIVVSPTAAVLLREIEWCQPTLLIDEVDMIFSNGRSAGDRALRAILNSGFERGRTVPRCFGKIGLQQWNVFCPKVLAGIGSLPDTLKDRCLPIPLLRPRPGERVERFRSRDAETVACLLCEELARWATNQVIAQLAIARPQMPEGLSDRQADICEPLLAIAELAGGDWPERSQRAILAIFTEEAAEESNSVKLLIAIRDIFEVAGTDRLSTETLLQELINRDNGEPWPEWWERSIGSGNTRGPGAKLAAMLKKFGIHPKVIRLRDGTTPRGYMRADFEDSWDRYCPAHPADATDAT